MAHRISSRRGGARQLVITIAVLTALSGCATPEDPVELRGVWLTNVDSDVLRSRETIAEAMDVLAASHFNVVFPVVWNKGYTLYPSAVMDSLFGIPIDPVHRDHDPLREVIEEAHARGLAVIPWFEFGFSSSYDAGGGHLLARRPDWAARDSQGRLLAKNGFEWMNAYHPEVQEFVLALICEVARRYQVDGIQGDDRLPAQPVEGGYADYTRRLYAQEHGGKEPPRQAREPAWVAWRARKLTDFAVRVHAAVKAIDPKLVVCWAPSIYPWSREEYLQDWPSWIRRGAADLVIPQVYRYDLADYRRTLLSQSGDSLGLPELGDKLFPGMLISLGEYLIADKDLLEEIRANRQAGFHGESLFFYEGLRRQDGRLARLLRSTVYERPARIPFPLRSQAPGAKAQDPT